ncbi:hypothetical protein CWC12_10305 [Pseudoalteromonas ruthenica]|nr:hypothetical protein [Pseudoalteromonas ruthenica]TMO87663.1 hypothetical protein CWC12_10305 [Pseudoalteromonas ruthenica]TMP22260.1 hypothetical protein CWC06_15705 [Pseudoalteromonas ruthenica]
MGFIQMFKANAMLIVVLGISIFIGYQQYNINSLESELVTANSNQELLKSDVETLESNTTTLETALTNESLERENLKADFEQSKKQFADFLVKQSELEENTSEAKRTITEVAKESNETDCINTDMPSRIIRLFDNTNTPTKAKDHSANKMEVFGTGFMDGENNFAPNTERFKVAGFERPNSRLCASLKPVQLTSEGHTIKV